MSRREEFGAFSISWCDDGLFDEIVAERVDVHIERMDDGRIWFRFSTKDDRRGSISGSFIRKDGRKIDAMLGEMERPQS